MGIMYKLMKQKHSLDLDAIMTPHDLHRKCGNRSLSMEEDTNLTEEHTTTQSSSMVVPKIDKELTAGHILQLCKFLAEKSQRAQKEACDQQLAVNRLSLFRQAYSSGSSFESDEVTDSETEVEEEALALVAHNRLQIPTATNSSNSVIVSTPAAPAAPATFTQQPSASKPPAKSRHLLRNSVSSSAVPITSSTSSSSIHFATPARRSRSTDFQFYGSKRDILQKIRNQIFERKRQRHLASMQRGASGNVVWRPW